MQCMDKQAVIELQLLAFGVPAGLFCLAPLCDCASARLTALVKFAIQEAYNLPLQ